MPVYAGVPVYPADSASITYWVVAAPAPTTEFAAGRDGGSASAGPAASVASAVTAAAAAASVRNGCMRFDLPGEGNVR